MKAIRRSPVTRAVVWLLTVALIMPVLVISPGAVGAQQPATMDVIVANFNNNSGYGGAQLAQTAADAVAVELSNSGRYTVSQPSEVLSAARELGLRVPSNPNQPPNYTKEEWLRIAKQLGAGGIVQGSLEQARFNPKAGASIGMVMTIMETSSGEYVNGGAYIGKALPRPGQEDPESLYTEAITNDATAVVQQAVQRSIPPATVLNINGGTGTDIVILNHGLRDGLHVGQDMIILRNGVRVGKIRIARAYATDSEADVLENVGGIKPQDIARALYTPPTIVGPGAIETTRGSSRVNFSAIGTTLSAIGLGVLIAVAAKGGQTSTTNVTAEPTEQGAIAAVRVSWGDNIFGNGGVLEYHIYRDPDWPFSRTFVGSTTSTSTTTGTGTTTGTTTGSTIAAAIPAGITSPTFHQFLDLAKGARDFWNGLNAFQVGGIPVLGGTVIGGGGNTGTGTGTGTGTSTGTSTTGTSCAIVIPAPTDTGVTPGTTYHYFVNAIIARQTVISSAGGGTGTGTAGGGLGGTTTGTTTGIGTGTGIGTTGTGTANTGNNNSIQCIETDPAESGPATPVTPPTLLTPPANTQTVDITAFAPTWTSTNGADLFQVEVSTDSTFKNASRIFHTVVFSSAPNANGVTQNLPNAIDLTAQPQLQADPTFLNFITKGGTPPRIYWRVGARHDSDSPGPVNWISNQGSDPDRTWRWVYSQPQVFFPAPTPPGTPSRSAAAAKLNRALGSRAADALPLPLPGEPATASLFKPQQTQAITIGILRRGPQHHK